MSAPFVVREEGGAYEAVSFLKLVTEFFTPTPIFGVRVGSRRYIYDRILRRLGYNPFRIWIY